MPTIRPFALFAATALCLTLTACGGGSSSTSSSTTAGQQQRGGGGRADSAPPTANHPPAAANQPAAGPAAPSDHTGAAPRSAAVAPLRVSGGGSAQFHVKGGDNSVQEYGDEAAHSELRGAAEAAYAFFVARVRGDWNRACSYLARSTINQLEAVAARALTSRPGCPAALAALTPPLSDRAAREATALDAASLRRHRNQFLLIYVGLPGRTVYALPLRHEGGAWKLTALAGDALPGLG